jgi:methylmalonyl-CoA/ethylmalonyl-CoA epimerase
MKTIDSSPLGNPSIAQIAFVVDDLETASLHWARTFGAGPFFLHDRVPLGEIFEPDGTPAVFEQGAAFGQWGPLMVELITFQRVEPASAAAIVCKTGLSHIAYFASDTPAEVERLEDAGAPALLKLQIGDYDCYWHDARDTIGCLVEHYPYDAVAGLYGPVADAARNWDGSDPVRGPILT